MDKKTWPTHMLPTRHLSHNKRPTETESEELKKHILWKWTAKKKKKTGVATLVSEKIDVNTKAMQRDTEHFIILKGRIHQEDINIVIIYTPNIGILKYISKILEDFKKK